MNDIHQFYYQITNKKNMNEIHQFYHQITNKKKHE